MYIHKAINNNTSKFNLIDRKKYKQKSCILQILIFDFLRYTYTWKTIYFKSIYIFITPMHLVLKQQESSIYISTKKFNYVFHTCSEPDKKLNFYLFIVCFILSADLRKNGVPITTRLQHLAWFGGNICKSLYSFYCVSLMWCLIELFCFRIPINRQHVLLSGMKNFLYFIYFFAILKHKKKTFIFVIIELLKNTNL